MVFNHLSDLDKQKTTARLTLSGGIMTARLLRPDGSVARTWETNDRAAAMTADRNCPSGWKVVVNA